MSAKVRVVYSEGMTQERELRLCCEWLNLEMLKFYINFVKTATFIKSFYRLWWLLKIVMIIQ